MVIVLVGESASGKSSAQNAFLELHPEYKKVITYTSRPKREGEIDGVDYHFVSDEEFGRMISEGAFAEYTEYNGWYYGTGIDSFDSDNVITVMNPPGLRAVKRCGVPVLSIYIRVGRRERMISILNRGDNIEEAYRRNLTDVGQFAGIEQEVDYVIDNPEYDLNPTQIAECIGTIVDGETYEEINHPC